MNYLSGNKLYFYLSERINLINRSIVIYLLILTASVFNYVSSLNAQEINPTQLQSEPQVRRRGVIRQLITPEILLKKPKNADKLYITASQVTVASDFTELSENDASFIKDIKNNRVKLSDLYDRAVQLQNEYNKLFPLVRLTFKNPPEPGSKIELQVIDKEIIDIDLSNVPQNLKTQIYARLEPLLHKRHLTTDEYQRQILLIGTIASSSGQTTIKYSNIEDGYVLVASIIEIPFSASTIVDNRLPYQLGTFEATQSVGLSNRFGFGEQLSFSTSSTFDFSNYFTGTSKFTAFSGDLVAPIGSSGLTAGTGYYSVRGRGTPTYGTFPDQVYDFVGQRYFGHYERASGHLQYPIILNNDRSLKIQGLYDHITNRTSTGPGPLGFDNNSGYYFDAFRDRYSAGRLTTEGRANITGWEWGGSIMALSILSHGLGGRTVDWNVANNQLLSRPFTSPYFSKFGLKIKALIGLPEDFQLTLIGRSQTSFGQPLPITEMLSFDGYEAVSGFGAGTLNVDKGVTARAELSHLVNIEVLDQQIAAAPYIFASYGRGQRSRPFLGEPPRLWAETFGGGVRADTNLTGSPFGEYFSFEAGKDYSSIFYYPSGYRTNVAFNMKYAGDPGIKQFFEPQPEKQTIKKSDGDTKGSAWNGLYAGITSGYNWDPRSYVSTTGSVLSRGIDNYLYTPGFDYPSYADTNLAGIIGKSQTNSGGAINGAQVGINITNNKYLIGLESDISGLTSRNRHDFWNVTNAIWPDYSYDTLVTYAEAQKNVKSLATFRARGGYLFSDRLLGYLTTGLALGQVNAETFISQQYTGDVLSPLLNNTSSHGGVSQTRYGWTAGAGIEWLFAPNMSMKAEYLYYDIGRVKYSGTPIITTFQDFNGDGIPSNIILPSSKTQFVGDVARVGLNYHLSENLRQKSDNTDDIKVVSFSNGFYAGLNGGAGWNKGINVANSAVPLATDLDNFGSFSSAITQSLTNTSNISGGGIIGGGGFGYNYFIDKFLLGLETDLQGSSIGFSNNHNGYGAVSIPELDLGNITTKLKNEGYIDWLGTGRLRIGLNIIPSIILYATGGLAYGGTTARSFYSLDVSTIYPDINGSTAIGSDYRTKFGWVAGAGIEWLMFPNVSLKGEYFIVDIGQTTYGSNSLSVSAPDGGPPSISYITTSVEPQTKFKFGLNIVRIGLNYHFDLMKSLPKITN